MYHTEISEDIGQLSQLTYLSAVGNNLSVLPLALGSLDVCTISIVYIGMVEYDLIGLDARFPEKCFILSDHE